VGDIIIEYNAGGAVENKTEKPTVLIKKHLEYLDFLRGLGENNMFEVRNYLLNHFPRLNRGEIETRLESSLVEIKQFSTEALNHFGSPIRPIT